MVNPIITVRLPKSWKSTLIILTTGGALIGISYWLWSRAFKGGSRRRTLSNTETSMDLPFSKSKLLKHRPPSSIGTPTSYNTSSTRRRAPAVTMLTQNSDFDESSSSLDCGRLGLRTLAEVVEHLEVLMSNIRSYEETGRLDPSTESGRLINELRHLLEEAYHVREQYRQKLILQEHTSARDLLESDFLSDDDSASYQSAMEQIDLTELEWLMQNNLRNKLLYSALQLLDTGSIQCRSLRTQLVGCNSDAEYLAKLHCIRQAFDFIFSQKEPSLWIRSLGKLAGLQILHCLDYPTADFEEAYERMLSYVDNQRTNPNSTMTEELTAKGVKAINFYDVVIDLMLLEAFQLLAEPPGSILSVTRHRLLSNSFKKVALDSAVWTILLAKKKLLQHADGFYAHYYTLVGTVTPALAWGFLGPDDNALRLCTRFRDLIIAFLQEAFITRDTSQLKDISDPRTTVSSITDIDEVTDVSASLDGEKFLDSYEQATDLDDDDNSTLVLENTNNTHNDAVDETLSRLDEFQGLGIRYTTLSDLSSDLYALLMVYAERFTQVTLEESKLVNNPLPNDYLSLPSQPVLYVV